MTKNRSPIPLCRSAFLQDVTIAVGRRSLKSLRQSNPKLTFDVAEDDVDGVAVERLDIEARTVSGRLTKITLWENGNAWVYARERAMKTPSQPIMKLHANLAEMAPEQIAELLRATLADPQSAEQKWRQRITITYAPRTRER